MIIKRGPIRDIILLQWFRLGLSVVLLYLRRSKLQTSWLRLRMTFAVFSSHRPLLSLYSTLSKNAKNKNNAYFHHPFVIAGHKNSFPEALSTLASTGGVVVGATSFPWFPLSCSSHGRPEAQIAASSRPLRASAVEATEWFSGCGEAAAWALVEAWASSSSCCLRRALRSLCWRRRSWFWRLRPGRIGVRRCGRKGKGERGLVRKSSWISENRNMAICSSVNVRFVPSE